MNNTNNTNTAPVALSILLDRSGSMMSIADDIVDGLNRLLTQQRTQPGRVIVTLAQFDTHNPFELVIDAVPLREVTDMDRAWFQPRGGTPLFDSIGRLISHVEGSNLGQTESVDHVVVIVTDGEENSSTEFNRQQVFDLIDRKGKDGWVFIYLGSEPQSYADADALAVSHANARHWDKSAHGTRDMMDKMSQSLSAHRDKSRYDRRRDKDDFYGDGGDRPS